VSEMPATAAGSNVGVVAGSTCVCVDVDVHSGFGRRFSSPARTVYHVGGQGENPAAVAG